MSEENTPSQEEIDAFKACIEKHKAADQLKVFHFRGKYYRLKRDLYNVMNWVVSPLTAEEYKIELNIDPNTAHADDSSGIKN